MYTYYVFVVIATSSMSPRRPVAGSGRVAGQSSATITRPHRLDYVQTRSHSHHSQEEIYASNWKNPEPSSRKERNETALIHNIYVWWYNFTKLKKVSKLHSSSVVLIESNQEHLSDRPSIYLQNDLLILYRIIIIYYYKPQDAHCWTFYILCFM